MATLDQIKSVLYGTETGNRPSKVFDGAGTARYRVLFIPFCAWVATVVLVMPVVVAAQQAGIYKADKKRILTGIESVERTLPPMGAYGFPSNGSADKCILAETDRCIGDNQPLDQLPQATRAPVSWRNSKSGNSS